MKFRPILILMAVMAITGYTGCTKDDISTSELGNWVKRSEFDGYGRSDAVSFSINGKAYLGTGFDGRNRLTDFWEYDPKLDAWIQKADFGGVARSGAVGFSAANNGYIATGYDGINYLNDCWKYDPENNTWTRVSDFAGEARYGATAFSINNIGYVTTGYSGRYLKDFWKYDPATDQWTALVSMGGTKRRGATAFVLNNIAYLFGGENNGVLVSDFWAYNPATDSWTQKRDITNSNSDESYDDEYTSIARYNAVAFTIGDTAYVATGDNSSLIRNVWQYDPATDLWVERTSFDKGTPRMGAVAFSVDNRGFIATGGSGQGSVTVYDDLWEFQPYVENDDD